MDLRDTPPAAANSVQQTNSGQAQGNVAAEHIENLTQNFSPTTDSFDFSKKAPTRHLLNYGKEEFVETSVYTAARDCLQRHGCITLTGGPGDGKTAMACHLLRLHQQQGARLVVLQEPADLTRLLDLPAPEEGSTVVFVDDIFGQFTSTQEKILSWHEPLVKANISVMSQTSPETKHRFYFVFTSRQLKVREAEPGLDSLHHSLFRADRVIDVGKLTREDKVRIFFHHAKLHKREDEFSLDQAFLIASPHAPHGFPHICHLFFDQNVPNEKLADFFSRPFEYVSSSIKQMLDKTPAQALLLTCLMLSDGRLCLDALDEELGPAISSLEMQGRSEKGNLLQRARSLVVSDEGVSAKKVKHSVKELQGSYICLEGDECSFSHPLFHDIVCFLQGELNPKLVVEHCSRLFLYERVTLCLGSEVDRWSICLSPKHRPVLISRFVRELVGGHYLFVCLHPALTELGLVEELVDKLRTANVLEKVLTENGKEGHGFFLVCSIHSRSKLFHELFRICRESDSLSQTCLSDSSLEAIVTQCCVNDNVSPLDDLKEHAPHTNFLKVSRQTQLFHQLFIEASVVTVTAMFMFQMNMNVNVEWSMEYLPRSDHATEGLTDVDSSSFEHDQYLQTTLSLAVWGGSNGAVEKLLSLTSDILTPVQVRDAFLMACMVDNADAVTSIAHHKHLFSHLKSPLLTLPVLLGAASVAKTLVSILREWGYDKERLAAEVGGRDDITLLKVASILGQTKLTEFLTKDEGSDVSSMSKKVAHSVLKSYANYGATPLIYASRMGHYEMVDVLIPFSDVNAARKDGATALMLAAQFGHSEVVRLLLSHSDVKGATQDGVTALLLAAHNGHSEVVQILIENSDVKAARKDGVTALILAAHNGHSEVIKVLIPHSDVKAAIEDGNTALIQAAENGHSEVVKLLLRHSDVKAARKDGTTALMLAAHNGHSEVVQVLIPQSDVKAARKDGATALMPAAQNDHREVVKLLIPHSDVKAATQDGVTALLLAAQNGHSEVVKLLIEHSDVKAARKDGATALMLAAHNGHSKVVQLLIPQSDVKAAKKDGVTALMLATENGHSEVIKVLNPQSDVKAALEDGTTALLLAAQNGHSEVVKLLIELGDVKAARKDGVTALRLAAQNGHSEVVQLLIPYSDVKAAREDGVTALILAAQNGHSEVVKLLIPHSDVKAATQDGVTALMSAAQNGHSEVIKVLIPNSDVKAAEKDGATALMLAAENGHSEVVQFPIEHSDVKAATKIGDTALTLAFLGGHLDIVDTLIPHSGAEAILVLLALIHRCRLLT